jgi:2-aminoadipate transaminase
MIESGTVTRGDRLPPTRELAGQLGVNRTTVSAAYALLEENGQIDGQVGRGSFIAGDRRPASAGGRDWEAILPPLELPSNAASRPVEISFASSRPAQEQFPLPEFRRLAKEVIDSPEATEILQLGSSLGYLPFRRFLLEQAVLAGIARPTDDLIVTNGCQQALDLLARIFFLPGGLAASAAGTVAIEDPVYHGLLRVFARTGAEIAGVSLDEGGIVPDALEQVLARHRPKLLVVTPSFQNPTGTTLSLERRQRIIALAQVYGCVLVENDIYSELRYTGKPLPTLKQLDQSGNTILLRSFSKVAFPGLRVGWMIAPRPVIARLAEAKEISDLHSDQLSQAVLLRFAQSSESRRYLERACTAGEERLQAVIEACARYLPEGAKYTRPEGGMSLWIELPAPLTAAAVLEESESRGVSFLPGKHFSLRRSHARALRISFGGLRPAEITSGIRIISEAAEQLLTASAHAAHHFEAAAALV